MTSLKLFYQRGASAAVLLGLIVGAPDIAQAVQLRGGFYPAIRPSAPTYIPPRLQSLPNYPATTGALSNPNLPPAPYARPTLPVLSNPNLPPYPY
jgi:hypothetical protein